MFGKKHHYEKRSPNIVFVIFRLILSVVMFGILTIGIYSAYKQFSGLDPLKIDLQAVVSELLAGKVPDEVTNLLSSIKITEKLSNQIKQKESNNEIPSQSLLEEEESPKKTNANLVFKFLAVADSHSDTANLEKAINQAKLKYPDLKFIIGLGDFSEVGTISELTATKKVFDGAGLRYFLIPGDHDLWDCRNRQEIPTACFKEVFGPSYQTFSFEGFQFLLINNSDNYTGIDEEQKTWIFDKLENLQEKPKGVFVFIHTPFYHPFSEHVMGWVQKELKIQASQLIFELKEKGVSKIFAGDIHYFSQYKEPKTDLDMMTVGAVSMERNPQVPRFSIVSVFEDGSSEVEDIEIK